MDAKRKELLLNALMLSGIGALWILGFFGYVFLVELVLGKYNPIAEGNQIVKFDLVVLFLYAFTYMQISILLFAAFGDFSAFEETKKDAKDI
jgi:multisubunit Na+/H+ antiporter MnhB subunit